MNYLRHFGLREPPFGITPDTHYFYACRSPQEALNTLLVAVGNGEGFIKITGEVGTGKTLLCRKFLATLGDGWVTAYVPNPNLDPRSILLVVAEELGLTIEPATEQYQIMRAITRALLDRARARQRVVLCMDEAQAMSHEALETVRLLTNLETEKRKLIQVVLFAQPELDRKLQSPSLRQLLQRITFQHRLLGLAADELKGYLAHRLTIAGSTREFPFTSSAVGAIHRASRGIPRLVNVISHKALLVVFGEGGRRAGRRHVEAASHDTPAAAPLGRWWLPRLGRALD
ncbi:MAG TPA: AAA family ATPase [Burkholderiales bacterium]|nr:AAA family ATPase [Burkholderiales bacterium]